MNVLGFILVTIMSVGLILLSYEAVYRGNTALGCAIFCFAGVLWVCNVLGFMFG